MEIWITYMIPKGISHTSFKTSHMNKKKTIHFQPRCQFTGPKNSRFPGPSPLPLALVMDMHASKTLCTGLY
jgi:hypothetical protein